MADKSQRSGRLLGTRTVFTGRVFHVDRDDVRLPNGRRATMDIVRHRGSVVMIPEPAAGSVILIRQYRHAIRRWIWELPAGTLDPGESSRRAARRECEEEIGLTPRTIKRLASLYPTPGFCDERMDFYLCAGLGPVTRPVAHDADEDIRPKTFTLAAARRLLARGDILDMKTVVGLTLLERGSTAKILGPSGITFDRDA